MQNPIRLFQWPKKKSVLLKNCRWRSDGQFSHWLKPRLVSSSRRMRVRSFRAFRSCPGLRRRPLCSRRCACSDATPSSSTWSSGGSCCAGGLAAGTTRETRRSLWRWDRCLPSRTSSLLSYETDEGFRSSDLFLSCSSGPRSSASCFLCILG